MDSSVNNAPLAGKFVCKKKAERAEGDDASKPQYASAPSPTTARFQRGDVGGTKPTRVIRRMTMDEQAQQLEKTQHRQKQRGLAFYGTDEDVAHFAPINPLGFLPTPPKSTSGYSSPTTSAETLLEERYGQVVKSHSKRLHFAFADTQGRRKAMEDQLIFAGSLTEAGNVDILGIFDGHDGTAASAYVQKNMPPIFLDLLSKYSKDKYSKLLKQTFEQTNQALKQAQVPGGTTALLCCLIKDRLVIANAGDCRAVRSCKGGGKRVTVDHRPGVPSERSRIEKLGGHVTVQILQDGSDLCRVQGILSVARSLGDFPLAPYVTGDPDVFELDYSDLDNEFIVIGCDGLWDEVNDSQCVEVVKGHLEANPDDWEGACQRLRNLSYANGSKDNITVVIVHNGTLAAKGRPKTRSSRSGEPGKPRSKGSRSSERKKQSSIKSGEIPEGGPNTTEHFPLRDSEKHRSRKKRDPPSIAAEVAEALEEDENPLEKQTYKRAASSSVVPPPITHSSEDVKPKRTKKTNDGAQTTKQPPIETRTAEKIITIVEKPPGEKDKPDSKERDKDKRDRKESSTSKSNSHSPMQIDSGSTTPNRKDSGASGANTPSRKDSGPSISIEASKINSKLNDSPEGLKTSKKKRSTEDKKSKHKDKTDKDKTDKRSKYQLKGKSTSQITPSRKKQPMNYVSADF